MSDMACSDSCSVAENFKTWHLGLSFARHYDHIKKITEKLQGLDSPKNPSL